MLRNCLCAAQAHVSLKARFVLAECVRRCRIRWVWRELGYLGSEVLLSREGFSESTEAMLDQFIQVT